MENEMMKVLFIACLDSPHDHAAGSGKDYDLHQGLVRCGADVHVVGPFPFSMNLAERALRKAHSLLFKRRPLKYPLSFLKNAARQAVQAAERFQPDVIFSKHTMILGHIQTELPLVALSDTTLFDIQQVSAVYSRLAYLRQKRWEQIAFDNASRIIAQSDKSAEILKSQYRQPREKIHIIPAPASIPDFVVPDAVEPVELSPLKILLVGREYHRKGVDIAIEVSRLLNQQGIPNVLRVVGLEGESSDSVHFMGLYNKTIPEELAGYIANYRWANFLIHPARFEAAGIVPSEAAAFGVPTITNNVGGLGTTVADGVSGVVLPEHSPPEAYVQVFRRFYHDPQAYQQLVHSTRKRFEEELNWDIAAQRLYEIVLSAVNE